MVLPCKLLLKPFIFLKEVLMAYTYTNSKGKKYFLHVKKMERASGKVTELYYFSTDLRKAEAVEAVAAGKIVIELPSGMPALKKKLVPPGRRAPPNALSNRQAGPVGFLFPNSGTKLAC